MSEASTLLNVSAFERHVSPALPIFSHVDVRVDSSICSSASLRLSLLVAFSCRWLLHHLQSREASLHDVTFLRVIFGQHHLATLIGLQDLA